MESITNNNFFRRLIEETEQKEFTDYDVEKWKQILENRYESVHERRLPYSQITNAIYNIDDPQKFEQVKDNFSKVREATIQWDLDQYKEITDKLEKVEDHIQLAITQRYFILNNVSELDEKLNEKENELEYFKEKLSNANNELEELKTRKTNVYTEFVTILGIFTTIIFASFGGLSILQNVFGNITNVATSKLMILSSLTISAIVLLLFILLNGLARLTKLNLRSCGCDSSDADCRHNIFQKHPSFVASLMIMFYIFILGIVGYIVDYEEILEHISNPYINAVPFILLLFPFVMRSDIRDIVDLISLAY